MEVVLITLIQYLREHRIDATNESIARTLVTHIQELKYLSLDQLADLCACSPSTFSRFLKTIGFNNFRVFHQLLIQPQLVYHQEGFSNDTYLEHIQNNLEIIYQYTNTKEYQQLVLDVYHCRHLVLISFPTNQSFTLDFQCKMILANKPVEAISTVHLPKEINKITKDDLVMLISFKGNFENDPMFQKLLENHIKIYLITLNKDSDLINQCQEIVLCGQYYQNGEEMYPFLYFLDCLYQSYYQMAK